MRFLGSVEFLNPLTPCLAKLINMKPMDEETRVPVTVMEAIKELIIRRTIKTSLVAFVQSDSDSIISKNIVIPKIADSWMNLSTLSWIRLKGLKRIYKIVKLLMLTTRIRYAT